MKEFNEEDYLQLSGIQHFRFCRRQWALIHIEHQWEENLRTTEGELMHEHAHDSGIKETRGSIITTHNMRVFSASLGISGNCDIVEFHQSASGIQIDGKAGLFQPYPIEYKRGKPKEHDSDFLQLCAQAMCLEEMLCCDIPKGAFYYGELRKRVVAEFTSSSRDEVKKCLEEMHQLYQRGYTPKVKPSKSCNACSLKELCLPKLLRNRSVADYMRSRLKETI